MVRLFFLYLGKETAARCQSMPAEKKEGGENLESVWLASREGKKKEKGRFHFIFTRKGEQRSSLCRTAGEKNRPRVRKEKRKEGIFSQKARVRAGGSKGKTKQREKGREEENLCLSRGKKESYCQVEEKGPQAF